jgi:hypothetical protein
MSSNAGSHTGVSEMAIVTAGEPDVVDPVGVLVDDGVAVRARARPR